MAQLSPIFNVPCFIDADGNALAGARIYQYEAGSFSVLKDTYTTADGDVANANPIVLDSAGRLPAGVAIWLMNSPEAYNLVLTAPDGTTVLQSFDNITGITTPTPQATPGSIWISPAESATYLSPNSFLVPGNFAAEFAVGNRVRITQGGSLTYGVVTAVSFATPNTNVTIQNDGAVLNSGVTLAEYSQNIANGETVDAGGVSFFDALPYTVANTVGWKFKNLETTIAGGATNLARSRRVYTTTGGPTYAITPTPAITNYTAEAIWTVMFANPTSGACTLNINGVGAVELKALDAAGAKQDPLITANMVSDVAYDGTDWVVLDALPAAEPEAPPRGMQVFTSNGTFTTPAEVAHIKVTCVGGGGGGGGGVEIYFGDNYEQYSGGGGGGGATTTSFLSTSGGTGYTVAVGVGGAGGPSGVAGGAGGTTSFGVTLVTAAGGTGGGSGVAGDNPNGAGGSTGTGQIRVNGERGKNIGTGGNSQWGFGTRGSSAGQAYGGGGGGGFGSGSGGAGAPGVVIVEW